MKRMSDENKPLISVIVPVYNVEDYVDDCVRSIIDQTYDNIEILLIDDGSKDSSGKKCDEWIRKDKRIKVIHQANQGLSGARNTGLEHCTGSFITFVDSDDLISENCLEILYGLISQYKVSISQINEKEIPSDKEGWDNCICYTAKDYLLDPTYKTMAWGKLYHRSLWLELRFPVGRVYEDSATIYKAIYAAGGIAVSDQILYFCNLRAESINNKTAYSLSMLDRLIADEEAIVFYRERKEPDLLKKASRYYAFDLLNNYVLIKRYFPAEKEKLQKIKRNYRVIAATVLKDPELSVKTKILLRVACTIPGLWGITGVKWGETI